MMSDFKKPQKKLHLLYARLCLRLWKKQRMISYDLSYTELTNLLGTKVIYAL